MAGLDGSCSTPHEKTLFSLICTRFQGTSNASVSGTTRTI